MAVTCLQMVNTENVGGTGAEYTVSKMSKRAFTQGIAKIGAEEGQQGARQMLKSELKY